jgi:predicted permease
VLTEWTTDLRHAWRALLRTPGFLLTTVATLALAIGAVAGMFNVVNTVVLQPLPFASPDRLVAVSGTAPGSDLPERFNPGLEFYLHYKEQSKLIDGIFVFAGGTSTFRTEDRVERIPMAWPSNGMYSTLGVRPLLGRLPLPEDADRVILISYRLWQNWFSGDSAVIGRSYFTSGEMRQVIGVMPADFQFPTENVMLWVGGEIQLEQVRPGQGGMPMIVRMKDGVTAEALAAELTGLSKGLPERFGGPPAYARLIGQHSAVIDPVLDRMVGPTTRRSLWVLLGAVAIVLAIACANVANLFMVRSEGRHRDLAVRRAMGASRTQLIRLQMAEAFLVALVAGGLAVVITVFTLPLFLRAAPDGIPRLAQVGLDLPTVVAAFVLVLIAALACGVFPAMRASSPNLQRLRESGRGSTAARRHLGRHALVVAQTALALVLLIGAALLVRSFQQLRSVDPGYDTADLYTFQFAPEQPRLRTGPDWGQFHLEFMDRLRAMPGVQQVGIVNNIPLDEGTGRSRFLTDGMNQEGGGRLLDQNWTAGDYFRAMGITLLQGRIFTDAEAVTPNSNVIVSRTTADQMWPGQDPLGRRIWRFGSNQVFTVVGMVEDVKQDDWRDAGESIVYFPLTGPTDSAWAMGSPAYVIKSPRAATLGREVRDLVKQVAPEAPVYREFTMADLAERSMVSLSFTMLTLGVVSALALILGAVGLYGVMAYIVTERTREIGVRMALGATAGEVQRMVVAQGGRVVLFGAAIGIGVALLSTRALGSLLFGIRAVNPMVFAVMALTLIGVGTLASYLPARRASRVNPMESLRTD